MTVSTHHSVMQQEAIQGLNIQANGRYLDLTYGRGGHSQAILDQLSADGQLIAFDHDQSAIAHANTHHVHDARFTIYHQSFAKVKDTLSPNNHRQVNGILLDLGVSSPQLDQAERGFSFMRDGPLDMRMDARQSLDAATWLNQVDEQTLAIELRRLGEEPHARRIASAIVAARHQQPIQSTGQLAEIVTHARPKHHREHKHPATKTFQAIRMFINQELSALQDCLDQLIPLMAPQARLVVISFHSLEDRIVKRFIHHESSYSPYPDKCPIPAIEIAKHQRLRKINGLVRPTEAEIQLNPRARSARMRIAEKKP